MADHALFIEKKKTAVGNPLLFFQYLKTARDRFRQIRNKRIGHSFNSPFRARRIEPSEMGKATIDRTTDHLRISLFKLFQLVLKSVEFRRADKREVKRVEEKDDVFPHKIGEAKVLVELIVNHSFCFEFGSSFPYECHINLILLKKLLLPALTTFLLQWRSLGHVLGSPSSREGGGSICGAIPTSAAARPWGDGDCRCSPGQEDLPKRGSSLLSRNS